MIGRLRHATGILNMEVEDILNTPKKKFEFAQTRANIFVSVQNAITSAENSANLNEDKKAILKCLLLYLKKKKERTLTGQADIKTIDTELNNFIKVDERNCALYDFMLDLEIDFASPLFIYLSYADADYEKAHNLVGFLKQMGFDIFFSKRGNFNVGDEKHAEFEQNLRKAELVLTIVSENSKNAQTQIWEINKAAELKKSDWIKSIVIDSCDVVEPFSKFWYYSLPYERSEIFGSISDKLRTDGGPRYFERRTFLIMVILYLFLYLDRSKVSLTII